MGFCLRRCFQGTSDDGGFEEFDESWFRRAVSSRTFSWRISTCCFRRLFSRARLARLRAKAEELSEQQHAIAGEIERIDRLESLRDARTDAHLSQNRVRHLRDVLHAPDLTKVRGALQDLIVGVEARTDGTFWLLVGEGPLGTGTT